MLSKHGVEINGVDLITCTPDGQRISHFKVMIRPLKAINLLHRLIDGKTIDGPDIDTPQALTLLREPKANVERYDGLRVRIVGAADDGDVGAGAWSLSLPGEVRK